MRRTLLVAGLAVATLIPCLASAQATSDQRKDNRMAGTQKDLPGITEVNGLRPTVARVSLWTADAPRLEKFYVELFGFTRGAFAVFGGDKHSDLIIEAWKLDPGARMETVLLRAPRGDTELGITTARGHVFKPAPVVGDDLARLGSTYIVLYVPDLDEIIRRCQEQDVVIHRAPQRILRSDAGDIYEMAVYDPDGRVLLVVEDIPPPAG